MARARKSADASALSKSELDKVADQFAKTGSTPAGYAYDPHNVTAPFRKLTANDTKGRFTDAELETQRSDSWAEIAELEKSGEPASIVPEV